MCVFGSIHLVYKKLRVLPYLCIQPVRLLRPWRCTAPYSEWRICRLVRVLNLAKSTCMCHFGIVYLVYKVLRDIPYLCKHLLEFLRGSRSRSCTGQCSRCMKMTFTPECFPSSGELACASSESYTWCTRIYVSSHIYVYKQWDLYGPQSCTSRCSR